MHIFLSQSLEPATKYKYKVRTWSLANEYHESQVFRFHTLISRFHTLISRLGSFKFIAAGDIVTKDSFSLIDI
jgi:hypothetical protein